MKKFLLKILLYGLLALLSTIPMLYYLGVFTANDQLLFVSNSISCNAKSSFLLQHQSQLADAEYVILGSSMSLNNIDGEYLEQVSNKKTINLSSWGMTISDFGDFLPYIYPKAAIIINMSFTDFGKSGVEKYAGFPLGKNQEAFNKISNIKAFITQSKEIKTNVGDFAHQDYACLNFDSTGGVLLRKDGFHISPKRWEETQKVPSDLALENIVSQLQVFKNHTVYLFFSPEREQYKSEAKVKAIAALEKLIKGSSNSVLFFNNYTRKFGDSLFVDCYHLNHLGARAYTELMVDQIISSRTNRNQQSN